MNFLVTGSSGFIGGAVCEAILRNESSQLVATARRKGRHGASANAVVREMGPQTEWGPLLRDIEVVLHAAARVHVTSRPEPGSPDLYRMVNVDGTTTLARQAAAAGVKRFVFLSSVKVNGDVSPAKRPFSPDDDPAPTDAYAVSKHEAEVTLREIARSTGMEVVIIRPPLVYGPGVKANFLALMRWVHAGYPMPFGLVRNRRSLVALDNLVDLIMTCCTHPAAANETFMAADGEDVSTADLVRRLGIALGTPARLLPVPPAVLLAFAAVAGKAKQARKLLGDLRVDARKNRELLGWQPVVGMDDALASTARAFLEHRQ